MWLDNSYGMRAQLSQVETIDNEHAAYTIFLEDLIIFNDILYI